MQHSSRSALLVIDMQEAYFKSVNLKAAKPRLVGAINRLLTDAKDSGMLTVIVTTVHRRDKSTWTLNMLDDDQGFAFELEAETKVLSEIAIPTDVALVQKTRDSAFHETQLLTLLQDNGIEKIHLTGVSAHSCIFQTASDAYAHNLRVALHADAIGDENSALQEQAFDYLQKEYRQQII